MSYTPGIEVGAFSQQQGLYTAGSQPPTLSRQNTGDKYSTLYVSKGSASQMIGEILYSPSDTVEKLREAISMECGVTPGFAMKISSHLIPPRQEDFELVSRFLNPDFPVVVINPE